MEVLEDRSCIFKKYDFLKNVNFGYYTDGSEPGPTWERGRRSRMYWALDVMFYPVWRIRDVYPGSWFLPIPDPGSRIPDPKTGRKERGEKFFFVATNFTKCKIILFFNCSRKKFGPNFKELWNFLPKKLPLSSQKYEFGIRDPRSGIQASKRYWISDPDPQHWFYHARYKVTNLHIRFWAVGPYESAK